MLCRHSLKVRLAFINLVKRHIFYDCKSYCSSYLNDNSAWWYLQGVPEYYAAQSPLSQPSGTAISVCLFFFSVADI